MKEITTKKTMTSKRLERQDEFSSYLGIDLGDKHSCVCVLDRWGKIAEELRGRTTVKEFEEFFRKLPRSRVLPRHVLNPLVQFCDLFAHLVDDPQQRRRGPPQIFRKFPCRLSREAFRAALYQSLGECFAHPSHRLDHF